MSLASNASPYPWLSTNWGRFTEQFIQGCFSHAQLIHGARGIGAIEFAYSQARYLLCLSKNGSQACGVCKSCHLFDGEGHPDFMRVLKDEGAAEIKVNQIRDLVSPIAHTSQQGGAKVVLLYPAESMNMNAANALLKNLEEPPQSTYFLLVSHSPAKVLATVRSRCILAPLASPSMEQAKAWLTEQGVKDVHLLNESAVAPLTVIEWVSEGLLEQRQVLTDILCSFMSDELDLVSSSKKLMKLEYSFVLNQLLQWLQGAIKVQQGQVADNAIDKRLSQCSAMALFALLDKISHQKASFEKGANLNTQLSIDELLMNISLSLTCA